MFNLFEVNDAMTFDFKKYKFMYTADFETSTPLWYDKEYQKEHYNIDIPDEEEVARVWAYDICNKELKHITGNSIFDFFQMLNRLPNNSLICFHNLAFDGSYIISWLLENGFEHMEDGREKIPFTFSTCISDVGQHYAYQISFANKTIYIMDSMKYIAMSVADMAKMYELPIQKGDCDYNRYRFKDEPITREDELYIHYDTEIVMRSMLIKIEQGQTKFTQAGNAKSEFKKTFSKNDYDIYFPALDIKLDEILRKAYVGGFTYLNPKYACKDLYGLCSFDYNSMYPSQMLFKPMPFGEPEYGTGKFEPFYIGDNFYGVCIQNLSCRFALKEGKTPMIPRKKFFAYTIDTYLKNSGAEIYTLTLSSPDLELFFDNYEVFDVTYNFYYAFRCKSGRFITKEMMKYMNMTKEDVIRQSGEGSLYHDYFEKWRMIKETTTGSMRKNAKLMQNALYGAEACNPLRYSSIPFMKEDGILRYRVSKGTEAQPMYLPAAIFTTAWSRWELIRRINEYGDRFVYCDTDSLYLLGDYPPKGLPLNDTLYGFFKWEHKIERARFLGAKRYIYYGSSPHNNDYKWEISCCGASKEVKAQMCWVNFKPNREFNGKLTMKTVRGGKHLQETTYRLNVEEKKND